MAMSNQDIAEVFENIAGLLEIKGESGFKVRAYQRAARTIEYLTEELAQMVRAGRDLKKLPGIGEAIAEKVQELVSAGRLDYYERLKDEFPDGILTLMDVPGIGPKTANRICTELGISTIEGLERAIQEGRVADLPRLGPKAAENILRHLRLVRTRDRRVPLGVALPTAEEVIAALQERCPGVERLSYAGSLRRCQETIGDIDILGTADDPEQAINALVKLPFVTEVLAHGPKKGSVIVRDGLQVDLRIVAQDQFGSLLQYFTGSKQHNIVLREYANRRGLSLNEYGITVLKTEELLKFSTEEDFYEHLDLQYIPPELRQGGDEVEVAQRRKLPTLIDLADVKGDLHVHTDQSDGRNTLEEMVGAARQRGLHYIAITDHSAGRGIANGLSVERLREHIHRVREMDRRFDDITLLIGSEVDIRSDGTLDYPDDLLADLDVVVASVHSAMGQDRDKMTQRVIQAMESPHVDIIGHPTGRLLGRREPIDVDMEALLQAARRTGTAMEINANPERLDLKDTHARRAQELGVPLVISTDSHATESYDLVRFGVAVARRAWCEPKHVLNTRPLKDFLKGLKDGK